MKKFLLLLTFLLIPLLAFSSAIAATTADIVFVVDESGSMSGEHTWISGMVGDLDTALNTAGVTGNQYSLIGFGASSPAPHTLAGLGTLVDFQTATSSLVITGSREDGYAGIDYAYNNLSFRSNAAVNVILITDEDRDVEDSSVTYTSILSLLNGSNALLNAVVNASFETANAGGAIGVDSDLNTYFADGAGGFTSTTGGGYATSGYGTTIADYVNLAWASGGAAWDLNILRAGGLPAESFTNAFIDIKVQEIQDQETSTVPEPATLLLFGFGLLGLAGAGRRKK